MKNARLINQLMRWLDHFEIQLLYERFIKIELDRGEDIIEITLKQTKVESVNVRCF